MLTKAYVTQVLEDGGYFEIFSQAIKRALGEWFQLVADNPQVMEGAASLDRSVFLNRRTGQIICSMLENDKNVVITLKQRSISITINNEITLRFKKLNRDMRTMNIATKRNKRLWQQNQPLLPGEFDQWINITCGWQLDRTGSIKALAIVNEFGNQLHWKIEIDQEGLQRNIPEPLPLLPDNAPAPYALHIRDTERARRIAEEESNSESDAN